MLVPFDPLKIQSSVDHIRLWCQGCAQAFRAAKCPIFWRQACLEVVWRGTDVIYSLAKGVNTWLKTPFWSETLTPSVSVTSTTKMVRWRRILSVISWYNNLTSQKVQNSGPLMPSPVLQTLNHRCEMWIPPEQIVTESGFMFVWMVTCVGFWLWRHLLGLKATFQAG